ncbi:uncharacterized protein LOC142532450 [Primulina tabacum]|uniref:uncharacterized protein LOC142532450 n=1 Tax=Primulina tabacum TaxID=48773 RepID=UPI003F5A135C
MAPNMKITYTKKPSKPSMETLSRTMSHISFELKNQETINQPEYKSIKDNLPPISEVQDAKCECCGMSEECTPKYVKRVREKFFGRMVCGICSEAVNEEMEKNGGKREEALQPHFTTCASFNRLGRAYPVLCKAEAMGEILRKSRTRRAHKNGAAKNKGGIARSSSWIPTITKEMDY